MTADALIRSMIRQVPERPLSRDQQVLRDTAADLARDPLLMLLAWWHRIEKGDSDG